MQPDGWTESGQYRERATPPVVGLLVVDGDGRPVGTNAEWASLVATLELPLSAAPAADVFDRLESAGDNQFESAADDNRPGERPGVDRSRSILDAGDAIAAALRNAVDGEERPYSRSVDLPDGEDVSVSVFGIEEGGERFASLTIATTAVRNRNANRRFRERVMDEAPVGITVSDPDLPDNPIVYANAAFQRITGYAVHEVVGRNCRFLQGPDTEEASIDVLRTGVEEERPVCSELVNYRKNGDRFWNRVTIAPIRDPSGGVTHFCGFQENVSDRKEAERELETERDRFALLNQIVRHDIRNDMAVVLGWGEQLHDRLEGDGTVGDGATGDGAAGDAAEGSAEDALGRVLNAATHTKQLTEEIRDLADVVGSGDPELQPIDVTAAFEDEVERVRTSFEYRSQSVTVRGVGDLPADAEVLATPLLSSVLGNVLNNAIFHNDGPDVVIDVDVDLEDDTVVIRVADNGPGISDERKREVFGRGQKGIESPGSGLGLYLVDQLVDTYNGSVWIEDNEPRGTVFCLRLPRAE